MTELSVHENGHAARIPSSWDEMSPEDIRFAFRTFDKCVRKGRSPLEFNVRMLMRFLDIDKLPDDKTGRVSENVFMLCERCLGFLFEEGTAKLSFSSVRNPIPRIGRLHGPADLLSDLTFGEFRHATRALQAWISGKEPSDLEETVAILYRTPSSKANRAGRKAGPIDGPSFRRDCRRAGRIPAWKKNLVIVWFSSCLKYIQEGTITIDGEDVDMSLLFGPGEGSGPAFTWNDLLIQIAKEQTVGPMDRVDEEPFFSILRIMWSNYKEVKRYEATAKAGRRK